MVTLSGRACRLAALLALGAGSLCAAEVDPLDWPHWRGPEQNGVSRETGLVDRFNPRGGPGSNVLWKSPEAAGISTPIVLRGKLYTIVRDQPDTPQEGEKVLCLDARTGKVLWEHRYNVFLSDVPAERIGWGNCVADPATGYVYALGSCSLLLCLDGESGQAIWSRSLGEEFGMLSTYGGRTNTPVLFDDLVVASGVTTGWDDTARPTHRFFGFDKQDGQLIWLTGTRPLPEDTTYSTPFAAVIDGQALLIAGSGDGGVHAIQPRTGKLVWSYQLSRRGVNISPIVASNRVFVGHSEENPVGTSMGAVAGLDPRGTGDISKSGELWRVDAVMVGKSSPLWVDGRLYVVDDSAGLQVLDATNGESVGRPLKLGTAMRGSLLWADGKFYAATASGVVQVLQPSDEGVKSVFRTRLPSGEQCGGSPIVSHGRIYLPTTGGLYCLGQEGQQPQATPLPVAASEGSANDSRPALAQLVPAETIVKPGETVRFELRWYDAHGRRVSPPAGSVTYRVAPVGQPPQSADQADAQGGSIDHDGVFQAAQLAGHGAAIVTATGDGWTAQARVRIVPALPWKFDFADQQVPVTWIGARYRHEPRSVEGEAMIVKITTIPKGTRSQLWMGPTDLHDYSVQADLKAGVATQLPDMGVIAQRYTLDLMGQAQQLQIRTWPPELRMAKTIPFVWQAGVWYTAKLQAAVEGERAVLRAKVWPRDEAEPAGWTLVAEDAVPNLTGSPGLFGNSTNAEVFVDNVSVTAH